MHKAILLGGLGFGDEGKGATVDYLTREYNADTVFRYNGGHQAGHRVELPDGRSHVFSQFGSGTFAGATTHHTRTSMIEPLAIKKEALALHSNGVSKPYSLLTVDPWCLVTPRYLKLLNRIKETSRSKKHGSCGLGIGETKRYWLKHSIDSVMAMDLKNPSRLYHKLRLTRDRVLDEIREYPQTKNNAEHIRIVTHLPPQKEAELLLEESKLITLEAKPMFSVGIFEGAQGILLDEIHGFHPHTTWGDITFRGAKEFLQEYDGVEQVSLGVTRSYHTRHGSGPFPTDNNRGYSDPIVAKEAGNQVNQWQDSIRYGWLDLQLLKYGIDCLKPDYIVLNHVDQFPLYGKISRSYSHYGVELQKKRLSRKESKKLGGMLEVTGCRFEEISKPQLIDTLDKLRPVAITGHGPTHKHRDKYLDIVFKN